VPTPEALTTRAVSPDELPAFFRALSRAFGEDASDDDLAIERITAEAERTLAVFDGDEIVANAGAFTFDMTVPGGHVPTAGVTYVGVQPTHRRRGILRDLMRRQLADVHERGEPLAALWASEAAIYGRFGYGQAVQRLRIEIDRVDASLRSDLPTADDVVVRLVRAADATDDIEEIDRAVASQRPGSFVRDKRWIELLVQDPESRRGGMSSLQCAIATRGGRPVGYTLYRTKPQAVRPHLLPDGEVLVAAHAAEDVDTYVALARLLLSLDLMRKVAWWNVPLDTPLPHLLVDPRQARSTLLDGIYVRVVDVPTALTARAYFTDVDAVLEISDPLCPWNEGRWRLVARGDDRSCEPTDAEPDLRLTAESLGAIYLGGTSLASLAAAGRVQARDAATLRLLTTAFRSDVAPWCPTVF
jgi:predicted acetyltransferase